LRDPDIGDAIGNPPVACGIGGPGGPGRQQDYGSGEGGHQNVSGAVQHEFKPVLALGLRIRAKRRIVRFELTEQPATDVSS
jgi:hypothetical protein